MREISHDGGNGLLADFFEVEALADLAGKGLDAPWAFKHLAQAGTRMIQEQYSFEVCLPRMLGLYAVALHARGGNSNLPRLPRFFAAARAKFI
jgi:hypothetical protein